MPWLRDYCSEIQLVGRGRQFYNISCGCADGTSLKTISSWSGGEMRRVIVLSMGLVMMTVYAKQTTTGKLRSPEHGVLCDQYICADSGGISVRLTARYIGERQAKNLEILGRADLMAFTFDGGVFCDTREKLCRDDKYFGTDGKRSGKINSHFTEILFGK